MVRCRPCGRNGTPNAKVYWLSYPPTRTTATNTDTIAAGKSKTMVPKPVQGIAEIYHLACIVKMFVKFITFYHFYDIPSSKTVKLSKS